MRVPMKVDYGVRALVYLALYGEGKPVRTAEIASRQGIPEPYLDQVLTTLNKFGFIRSRRGPHGGHVLAKSPEEISLGDIMGTLEGRSVPLDCMDEPAECTLSSICAQREVWRGVEEAIQQVLGTTSVADLVGRQRDLIAQPS
jgi:Rrf2 family protein